MPKATGLTAIVMVGDEILSGHTQDTNSSLLARLAFSAGHPVGHIEVVGDQPEAIIEAIRRAIDDPQITRIAVCGGIGPTPDDANTRSTCAACVFRTVSAPKRADPSTADSATPSRACSSG